MKNRFFSYLAVLVLLGAGMYLSGCAIIGKNTGNRSIPGSMLTDSAAKDIAFDHYLAGSVAEETEENLEAAVQYQMAMMFDPSSATIATALARVYIKLDKTEAAKKLLTDFSNSHEADEDLLLLLAKLYLRKGQLEDAYNSYEKLQELRPLDKIELLRLAAMAYQLRWFEKARVLYTKYTIEYGPDPNVYDRLGRINLIEKNLDQSEKMFREVLKLDSTRHDISFILGGYAASREDWMSAENYFRTSIAFDSTELRYWSNLLLVLNEQHKNDAILEITSLAIDQFPESPQFYDIRGSAFEQLGRLDDALKVIDKSITIDSSRISPYLTKGFIHHQREEWELGAQSYSTALRIDPDNPLILNNYAYMLSVQNANLDSALAMVEKALMLQPNTSSFLDTRGWIFYRLNRYDEALRDVKEALKGDDDSAELYAHLGYIFQALGKQTDAKKSFKKAAELDPDDKEYSRLAR